MKTDSYNPGLHILSTIYAAQPKLTDMAGTKAFFDAIIQENGLTKVGEVYHQFDNSGFTAVICLVESHISIHTWPEFGVATFDVFLSNFMNDNAGKCKQIHESTLLFFEAQKHDSKEVLR